MPVLSGFNRILDVSEYSPNGKRTIAYLGELLYSAYFQYMIEKKGMRAGKPLENALPVFRILSFVKSVCGRKKAAV